MVLADVLPAPRQPRAIESSAGRETWQGRLARKPLREPTASGALEMETGGTPIPRRDAGI
jgi:hypothetical protein